MTGTELAAQMARTHPEARVLYTSGYTEDTILQHGMTGDQALFISKPYTKADLCQKVREALGSSLPE